MDLYLPFFELHLSLLAIAIICATTILVAIIHNNK